MQKKKDQKESITTKATTSANSVHIEKPAGSIKAHEDLVKKILLWCAYERPGWILWKNNTGKGITFHGSIVKFGLKGSPDIIGFTEHGTFVGIEVKTGNAVQNKFQKAFQKKLEECNGIYKVIRPGAILEKVL